MSTIIKIDKVSKAFLRLDIRLELSALTEVVNLSFSRLFVVFLCRIVELFLCVIKRWATAETFLKTWGY